MKLRKLKYGCDHVDEMHPYGHYVEHEIDGAMGRAIPIICPGGVFLPDDTLVIEKVDSEYLPRRDWPWPVIQTVGDVLRPYGHEAAARAVLDALLNALSVREAE